MIKKIYYILLKHYGDQGWWPINNNYHPKDYSIPKNKNEIYEICIGAILTQNTSWKNVEIALNNLRKSTNLNPELILKNEIKQEIKPAGYFNQKEKKIKIFTNYFLKLKKNPTRKELLDLWGIGKETADSILLYAYKQPFFVVDAYTKRLFYRLSLIESENTDYDKIKKLVETEITNFKDLNEFHALIVKHAKEHCLKKPNCEDCPLSTICKYYNKK